MGRVKMKVIIKSGDISLEAELYDNETASKIAEVLPIKGIVQTWGDEIYFEIPIHIDLDDSAKEVVKKGDLGFWPSGNCFCIFFGKTPASQGAEIRPASAVNVFGKVKGELELLKNIMDGSKIIIEKV